MNGRSHHPSESDSISSVNSTSDWKISSATKPAVSKPAVSKPAVSKPASTDNSVLKPQNVNNTDSQVNEKRKKKKMKKKRRSGHGEVSETCLEKDKTEVVEKEADVQRVNETTPSPINDDGDGGSSKKLKKKKKKSVTTDTTEAKQIDKASESGASVVDPRVNGDSMLANGHNVIPNGHESGKKKKKRMLDDINNAAEAEMSTNQKKKKKRRTEGELSKSMVEMNGGADSGDDEIGQEKKSGKKQKKLKKRYSERKLFPHLYVTEFIHHVTSHCILLSLTCGCLL